MYADIRTNDGTKRQMNNAPKAEETDIEKKAFSTSCEDTTKMMTPIKIPVSISIVLPANRSALPKMLIWSDTDAVNELWDANKDVKTPAVRKTANIIRFITNKCDIILNPFSSFSFIAFLVLILSQLLL